MDKMEKKRGLPTAIVLGVVGLILILFMVWMVFDSLTMKGELEGLKGVMAELSTVTESSTVVERVIVVEPSSVAKVVEIEETKEETVVVPIIMTMDSRSVTGGVVVEWAWQPFPRQIKYLASPPKHWMPMERLLHTLAISEVEMSSLFLAIRNLLKRYGLLRDK